MTILRIVAKEVTMTRREAWKQLSLASVLTTDMSNHQVFLSQKHQEDLVAECESQKITRTLFGVPAELVDSLDGATIIITR